VSGEQLHAANRWRQSLLAVQHSVRAAAGRLTGAMRRSRKRAGLARRATTSASALVSTPKMFSVSMAPPPAMLPSPPCCGPSVPVVPAASAVLPGSGGRYALMAPNSVAKPMRAMTSKDSR
jgi:hypothetical protein